MSDEHEPRSQRRRTVCIDPASIIGLHTGVALAVALLNVPSPSVGSSSTSSAWWPGKVLAARGYGPGSGARDTESRGPSAPTMSTVLDTIIDGVRLDLSARQAAVTQADLERWLADQAPPAPTVMRRCRCRASR